MRMCVLAVGLQCSSCAPPLHLFVGPSRIFLRFRRGLVAGSGMAVFPCYFMIRGVLPPEIQDAR